MLCLRYFIKQILKLPRKHNFQTTVKGENEGRKIKRECILSKKLKRGVDLTSSSLFYCSEVFVKIHKVHQGIPATLSVSDIFKLEYLFK